ncbi:MAG: hypothetical protein ACK56I_13830, partial [bacterium]
MGEALGVARQTHALDHRGARVLERARELFAKRRHRPAARVREAEPARDGLEVHAAVREKILLVLAPQVRLRREREPVEDPPAAVLQG